MQATANKMQVRGKQKAKTNKIKNKQNGYLFESGDYKKLSNKIIYAIENKKNSIIISKSSRNLIVENYSYEKEMKRVNEKYIEILSK